MAELVKRRLRMQVRATPENGHGTGQAVVSTLDLEYEIGWGWTEIIAPGCFDASMAAHPVIPIFYNHDWYGAPIGIGTPSEKDNQLLVDFKLYLGMGDLVERVYQAMVDKALEEWSIGFWAEEISWDKDNASCDLITKGDLAEASVCVRGANPETGTLELAGKRGYLMGDESAREAEVSRLRSRNGVRSRAAIPIMHTATSADAWDGPAQEANLDNEDGASVYRKAYAWVDSEKDADTKVAYKFIHHFVGTDGTVGDASTVACTTGIAALNGARGGTTIPDADVQGVYDHLAAHLKDAGEEPPELKSRAQRAAAEEEPDPGELAQSIDALIDQIAVLLDEGDTKGAQDLVVAADAASEKLLEVMGLPDDDDVASAEGRKRVRDAFGALADALGGPDGPFATALTAMDAAIERASSDASCATDGCGHMASVHNDTDDGDNTGACSTPDCGCGGFTDPTGAPTGGGDPGEDESSRALQARLMGTSWGRELLRKKREDGGNQ